jgi:hypothetical protein
MDCYGTAPAIRPSLVKVQADWECGFDADPFSDELQFWRRQFRG